MVMLWLPKFFTMEFYKGFIGKWPNMLSLHTPSTPGEGSKGHFFFCYESDHVVYQLEVKQV